MAVVKGKLYVQKKKQKTTKNLSTYAVTRKHTKTKIQT